MEVGQVLLATADNNFSLFRNVIFQNVHGMGKGSNPHGSDRNGWTMTGGVTVFNSKVKNTSNNVHSRIFPLKILLISYPLRFPFSSAHLVQAFLTPLTEIS